MSITEKLSYQVSNAGWIPQGWAETTLGKVVDFRGGNAFKEKFQGKEFGEFPFIKVSDFNLSANKIFIRDANNWIDEDINKEIRATLFEAGTVVFAKVGAALLSNRRRILARKTAIDNNLMAAIPRQIDPKFCYYHLQTVDLAKMVQEGAVPSVNQGQLQSLPFMQPSLPEQQKIAAILTAVDDKLDVIVRQIETTKALKKGLMQTLFSRGVGTQDATGRWIPHTEFKDSQLGEIPVGWEIANQGSVAKILNGRAYKLSEWEEEGTPVIRLQNLTGSGDKYYYSNLKLPPHQYVHNGDLLYMWSASFGPFIWRGEKAIYHYHIWKIECSERLDKKYMYYSLVGLTEAMKGKTNGTTMMHLTKAGMEKHSIALPPVNEQRKIAEIITGADTKIDLLLSRQSHYQALKSGLMQKLLTGEWRVKLDSSTGIA